MLGGENRAFHGGFKYVLCLYYPAWQIYLHHFQAFNFSALNKCVPILGTPSHITMIFFFLHGCYMVLSENRVPLNTFINHYYTKLIKVAMNWGNAPMFKHIYCH